jgi:5-methylcytosine-specific restriction endonuclease McrA
VQTVNRKTYIRAWPLHDIMVFTKKNCKTWLGKKRLEHSNKMSGENNPMFGKKLSAESIRKRELSRRKGGWFHNIEETRRKISRLVTGRKHTLETKAKISASRKGFKMSNKSKQKISITHTGKKLTEEHKQKLGRQMEAHHNWKGGITYEYRLFRKSSAYQKWRKAILLRDNNICQICKSNTCLQVHHILPFATHINLRTKIGNGITLCKECHKKEHQ